MYDTTVICTYNTSEVFLESDNITDFEKQFVRNAIYRQELLNIFGMKNYNFEGMSTEFDNLFDKIKDNKELNDFVVKLATKHDVDLTIGVVCLFSFDYLYLTHICMCELLNFNKINETSLANLKNKIFYSNI
jgi:hypothetical protein